MSLISSATEVPVQSVLEDFEIGDKVAYYRVNNNSLIGVVIEKQLEYMVVDLEIKGLKPFRVGNNGLGSTGNVKRWRKVPNDTLIQAGDIMSTMDRRYMGSLNSREFFVVEQIVPGKILILKSLEDGDSKIKFDDFAYGSLDEYLQHWDLEG